MKRFGMVSAVLLCLLAVGAAAADRGRHLNMVISPDGPPQTLNTTSEDNNIGPAIKESAITLSDTAGGFTPEQLHLTYWGSPDKMAVSFASSNGMVVMGEPPKPPVATSVAFAQYGTSEDKLDRNVTCVTTSYVQNQWAIKKSPSYVSPYLSHCLMTGLPAGSRVFYRVGWPEFNAWSGVHEFKTFKDTPNFPLRVGVMADLGLSYNSSDTVDNMFKAKAEVVLNIGDLPYADNFLPNGDEGTVKGLKYFLSYQPRWDMYGRMLEKLSTGVPVMTSTGNHEVEFQSDGTVFAAYNSRYPVPQDPSKGPNVAINRFSKDRPSPDNGLYYSWEVPGTAHFIALTSYITNDTFSKDTAQYKWFENDLKKVDRSKTPWLIVYFHAPFVSSYEASFKQVECMRLTYEPLMYKYGVDLVFNGHVHAYERSKPVYDYKMNPCGPIHITVGCGGKPGEPGSGLDALDLKYIEQGSFYCEDPKVLDVKPNVVQPLRCHTWQPDRGGFCWNKQPDFSAFRDSDFGLAFLTLINASHAEWKWDRNDGKIDLMDDYVIFDRSSPKTCLNRLGDKAVEGAAAEAPPPDADDGPFPAFASPTQVLGGQPSGAKQSGGQQSGGQQSGGEQSGGQQSGGEQQQAQQGGQEKAQQQAPPRQVQQKEAAGTNTASTNPFSGLLLPFLGGSGARQGA